MSLREVLAPEQLQQAAQRSAPAQRRRRILAPLSDAGPQSGTAD
jgi:hypothetical protein